MAEQQQQQRAQSVVHVVAYHGGSVLQVEVGMDALLPAVVRVPQAGDARAAAAEAVRAATGGDVLPVRPGDVHVVQLGDAASAADALALVNLEHAVGRGGTAAAEAAAERVRAALSARSPPPRRRARNRAGAGVHVAWTGVLSCLPEGPVRTVVATQLRPQGPLALAKVCVLALCRAGGRADEDEWHALLVNAKRFGDEYSPVTGGCKGDDASLGDETAGRWRRAAPEPGAAPPATAAVRIARGSAARELSEETHDVLVVQPDSVHVLDAPFVTREAPDLLRGQRLDTSVTVSTYVAVVDVTDQVRAQGGCDRAVRRMQERKQGGASAAAREGRPRPWRDVSAAETIVNWRFAPLRSLTSDERLWPYARDVLRHARDRAGAGGSSDAVRALHALAA